MDNDDVELNVQRRRVHSFSEVIHPTIDPINVEIDVLRRHSFSTPDFDIGEIFERYVERSGNATPRLAFPRMDSFVIQNPLDRMPSFLEESEKTEKDCSRVVNRFIFNFMENAEGKVGYSQYATIFLSNCLDGYRAVISSFLTVFVPQRCPEGDICSLYNNVVPRDNLEQVAIIFNALMAFYFCNLYYFEVNREKTIKEYLEISKNSSTSKHSLIKMMCNMQNEKRRVVLRMNNGYRIIGIYMLFFFFLNCGVSWAVVYKNYLDNSTFITFTTNALFMITKIYSVLKITSSGEYNIFSAYLSDHLVYNVEKREDDIGITEQASDTSV